MAVEEVAIASGSFVTKAREGELPGVLDRQPTMLFNSSVPWTCDSSAEGVPQASSPSCSLDVSKLGSPS